MEKPIVQDSNESFIGLVKDMRKKQWEYFLASDALEKDRKILLARIAREAEMKVDNYLAKT